MSVYDLRAPSGAPVIKGSQLAQDFVVEIPTTSGVLNTNRIMIRPDILQAQYLPDVRWGDEVPVMMQTLMLRSLENTNGLLYVSRRPLDGVSDYTVFTELMDFQAELTTNGSGAIISISMTSRIVRESDTSIVAGKTFTSKQIATSTDTPAIVLAFNRASDALLIDFADWTITSLGRSLSPA
jgi:cholesterol transport system auxiliary component